ncbi:helix-turn-helix domain-containing protein [Chitinophaga rhizosphaerae]|uniref:helix-turn-helix domain-containing protein n=1 Tax=Chitinophaga rhizosphaerae TaxID=1864947 RepID=UPI000F800C6C|nr:helix-turn-helix domain-containing protein [Chitinophaga rhizosphaerae]
MAPEQTPNEEQVILDFLKKVGLRIIDKRIEKGHESVADLSFEAKIGANQLRNYEKGNNMTMYSFARICLALKVNPEEFFKGIKIVDEQS